MIGPAGSGKTALVEQSALTAEVLEQVEVQGSNGLTWSVFENGVVLDVQGGWSFQRGSAVTSVWARLLRAIVRDRPSRPLDGIIVAVPVTSFLGPDALPLDAIAELASFLHARLRQVQAETGLHLPVYVLLTQCDAINGFAAFARGLSGEERQGLLGWSNPFSPELQFQTEWTDMALSQLRVALEHRLARIFAVDEYTREHDALFLLPGRLLELRSRLNSFLSRALRPAGDVPAPMFRGLFLTGRSEEGSAELGAELDGLLPASMPQSEASYAWGSLGLGGINPQTDTSSPDISWAPAVPVDFVADLFRKKIFPARALALPLVQGQRTRRRTDRLLQVTSAALGVVLAVGMVVGYRRIHRTIVRITPLLTSVSGDFFTHVSTGLSADGDVHTPTDDLLHVMLELRSAGLQSVFYPWSWGRSLEQRIEHALTPAARMFILERFERQLELRARQLTDPESAASPGGGFAEDTGLTGAMNTGPDGAQDAAPDSVTNTGIDPVTDTGTSARSALTSRPVDLLPEFERQRAFTDGMLALQQHLDLYTQLRNPDNPGGLQAVAALDGYLNHRIPVVLPDDASSPILDAALQQARWQPFNYRSRDQANAALQQQMLAGDLFRAAIEQNRVRRAADALVQALYRVQGARPAYDDIRRAQQAYDTVNAALADPQSAWIGAPDFHLPANLAAVTLGALGRTVYLPIGMRPRTEALAQASYQRSLAALVGARSPLTGQLLQIRDGQVELAPRAQEVQLGLDNLLNLSFMGSSLAFGDTTSGRIGSTSAGVGRSGGSAVLRAPQPLGLRSTAGGIQALGGSITWSKPALDAAASLPAALQHYLSEDLEQAPPGLQASLGTIAKDRLAVTLEQAVAGAETPGPRLPLQPQLETDVQPAVQAFVTVAPSLRTVLTSMRTLGLNGPSSRLQAVTSLQALTLLDALNRSFNASAPYTAPGPALDHWTGSVSPAGAFFSAGTDDDLAEYLSTERARVATYDMVAQPLLDFLLANGATGNATYRRWKGIDVALKQYEAKRPGSSLRLLETYLSGDFSKARLTSGCGNVRSPFPAGTSDYFVEAYLNIRAELAARCALLSGAEQGSAYTLLAERFNRTLAGRYPFGPQPSNPFSEADPQDVASVFALYDGNTGPLGLTSSSAQRSFLATLATLRPFFDALTAKGTASIDVVPRFRVLREREAGGDQIADWTLQIGAAETGTQVFRSGEPEHKGTWTVGQPVTLTIRWARNAPFVPAPAATPNMQASSSGVVYRFADAWALLRLVHAFQAPLPDQDSVRRDGGVLVFRIPEVGVANLARLQPSTVAEARVYLQLAMFAPGKPDAVAVPIFPLPAEAPAFSVAAPGVHAVRSRLSRGVPR